MLIIFGSCFDDFADPGGCWDCWVVKSFSNGRVGAGSAAQRDALLLVIYKIICKTEKKISLNYDSTIRQLQFDNSALRQFDITTV